VTDVFRHDPDVLAVDQQPLDGLLAVDGGDDDIFVLRLDSLVNDQDIPLLDTGTDHAVK